MRPQAIVIDIEGTVSALSFVQEVLFPYAKKQLPSFIAAHGLEPGVRPLLEEARQLAGLANHCDDHAIVAQLLRWADQDQKLPPLKALQGQIWAHGYGSGAFSGHLYEDAVLALQQWHADGIRLYVFSSGSVQAQKLLFQHSIAGDLTGLFSGFFDTRLGAKRDPQAYRDIVKVIGAPAASVLFLSDSEGEIDAATSAGVTAMWVVRGVLPGPAHRSHISEFSALRW